MLSSDTGSDVERAKSLSQGGLQLLRKRVTPAVRQRRSGVVSLSGPRGSQQQAPKTLSFQQGRHLLQEVTFAQRAQLHRTINLTEESTVKWPDFINLIYVNLNDQNNFYINVISVIVTLAVL